VNDLRQTKNGRGLWPLFLLGALCAGVRGVPARQLWRGNGDAVAHRPPLAARGQPHRAPASCGPVASPFFARREPGAAAGTAPGACQQAPRIPACRRSSSGMEMGVRLPTVRRWRPVDNRTAPLPLTGRSLPHFSRAGNAPGRLMPKPVPMRPAGERCEKLACREGGVPSRAGLGLALMVIPATRSRESR
jgi:hypothetical protein